MRIVSLSAEIIERTRALCICPVVQKNEHVTLCCFSYIYILTRQLNRRSLCVRGQMIFRDWAECKSARSVFTFGVRVNVLALGWVSDICGDSSFSF